MRTYIVQPGDTPARIAARDDMAGCPKCARDLVEANPHKPAVVYPNGFKTFKELREGEELRLPDKWFDGTLDGLPKSYFAGLGHPDGVTGVGDYPTLDHATTQVSVLDTMTDAQFATAANTAADLIDQSVSEVGTTSAAASANFANETHSATAYARQRDRDMTAAIASGDKAGISSARFDTRLALTTALGSARLCLQSFYGGPEPMPAPTPAPAPVAQQTQKTGISAAGMLGISVVGAGVVGGLYYLATRSKGRRVRRIHAT